MLSSSTIAMPVAEQLEWLGHEVELVRLKVARQTPAARKSELGQFFTPQGIARLMASMFESVPSVVRILDPGAGIGSLSTACLSDLCTRAIRPHHIELTAYELDSVLCERLQDVLEANQRTCAAAGIELTFSIENRNFLEASDTLLNGNLFSASSTSEFDLAILNPPYFKIRSGSLDDRLLQRLGISSTNIYTGFLAIVVRLLADNGQLVAITPRSFCNGAYFRSFREWFLKRMALRRVHVFASRKQAFQEDAVLQENVIMHATKRQGIRSSVMMSESEGLEIANQEFREVEYRNVVRPDDSESFIRIFTDNLADRVRELGEAFTATLDDLGLNVSTGRVVDFRARQYLHQHPATGTAPLIYPRNFQHAVIRWPHPETRKPQAIDDCLQTETLLAPNETYVLVKRFTAKEERRRVVAALYCPDKIASDRVGIENHLNYFHCQGRAVTRDLAKGLTVFLNSTLVDLLFRQFSGHTQVNATDLRNMKYPSHSQLCRLGSLVPPGTLTQREIDGLVDRELLPLFSINGAETINALQRIAEAKEVLSSLGFPSAQLNDRSALTLLALVDLKPGDLWRKAANPLRGITPLMAFFAEFYDKRYAPNSRETVRRQTIHQFLEAGLITANPDNPTRPINSGKTVYQIESGALELLRSFGARSWKKNLRTYLSTRQTLRDKYAQERTMARIALHVAPGKIISLSPGGQNVLVQKIVEEFAPRFTPGGKLIYVGDADEKYAYFLDEELRELGVTISAHGKMPDAIFYHTEKNWLVLVEAVTSHGPISPKRHAELERLFHNTTAGIVYVTAFLDRRGLHEHLSHISWETEVWIAESPDHLIHFNGERFLGPY